jgi:YVTN family beta-propeller protein
LAPQPVEDGAVTRRLATACLALLLSLSLSAPATADSQSGVCPTLDAGGALPRRAPALSADGSHLYVAIGSGISSIATGSCNGIADWTYAGSGSQGITQLVPDEAHGRIWAVNGVGSKLALLNSDGTLFTGPTKVADSSTGRAALRPGLDLLYVAVPGSGAITVRTEDALEAGAISTGGSPVAVAISPDETRGYVADDTGSDVIVLDLTKGSTWQMHPIGQPDGTIAVGANPAALALTPDGGTLLVGSTGDNTVSVVDTGTREVVKTITVADPRAIAVTPDGTRAYVASAATGSVVALDLVGLGVGGSVDVGGGPTELAMSPAGQRLFAGQAADGMLADIALDVPPAITTPAGPLPAGRVGSPYSTALGATGNPAPQLAVTAGALPTGLVLGPDGSISGTPTAAGTASFTVAAQATVSGIDMAATRVMTISVSPMSTTLPVLPVSWVKQWPVKKGRVRTARIGRRVALTQPALTTAGTAHHARFSYQWYVAGKPVRHATGRWLLVRKSYRGRLVTVRITVSSVGCQPRGRTISFRRAR